ncbi:MAG: cobalt ABC transporter ATP-binding protein [Actinomycetota bacterium]|jgi:energy-coupling factor transporter ATP-binding protein EcfA2|nr:MAG: cobalt ABC transporter ATP-binding protein [Actinomycetota bacterium]
MDQALRVDDVTFTYPDASRPALEAVRIEIPAGAFALVVGQTGAGKSTLLRLANGLVPHFSGGRFDGRVLVGGRDTRRHLPRELADAVAFVPQQPDAAFVLDRVEDELAYGMENLGVDPAHMRRRVEEVLDLLHLAALRDRSVRTLSGGERQRVAIGAALAAGPRLLVLDEPTSQLDPQGSEDVMAALQRLVHDHAITVVLAEHRLERVAGWVDLAVGLRHGRAAVDTPAGVLAELGLGPPVARLGRLLGWEPVPLTVREARRAASEHRPDLVPRPRPASAPGPALLRARGLAVRLGGAVVLHGIDLELRAGEVVAVLGRNGAGKTTLLRALSGLLGPDAGEVTIGGGRPEPGRAVALVPQDPEHILFADTVAEEVRTTLRARRDDGPAEPWLEALGIGTLAERHPRELSAGQRLLAAIAAVAATGAPVLALDEPTRGLDPASKERLQAFLRRHADAGGACAVATHDVELAASIADRVVILAHGEVIAEGDPARVLGDSHVFAPQMTRVFGAGWLTPEQVAGAVA